MSGKRPCFLRPRCPAAHQGRPWLPGAVARPKAELPCKPPAQQTLLLALWSSHFTGAFSAGSQLSAVSSATGTPESRGSSAESHCQPWSSQRWVATSALSVQLALRTAAGTQIVTCLLRCWDTCSGSLASEGREAKQLGSLSEAGDTESGNGNGAQALCLKGTPQMFRYSKIRYICVTLEHNMVVLWFVHCFGVGDLSWPLLFR